MVHNKTHSVTSEKELAELKAGKSKKKDKEEANKRATNTKRPAGGSVQLQSVANFFSNNTSSNVNKKQKLAEAASVSGPVFKQTNIRNYFGKEPVLNLCSGMAVSSGQPFSSFDSPCKQLFISWRKKGIEDESETVISGARVRAKIQDESQSLRKELIRELKGKVIHLCADMAPKDGRCFLGKRLLMQRLLSFSLSLYFKVSTRSSSTIKKAR